MASMATVVSQKLTSMKACFKNFSAPPTLPHRQKKKEYFFFLSAFVYLRHREREDTERKAIIWFVLQMPMAIKAGPSQRHESRTYFRCPSWVIGTQGPEPSPTTTQRAHQQEVGLETEAQVKPKDAGCLNAFLPIYQLVT